MKFRLDFVPFTFDQAVEEVINGLDLFEREHLLSLKGDELHLLNTGLGARIRDAWSLSDAGTPLRIECRLRGLPEQPDDLAVAILAKVRGELIAA